MIDFEVVSSNGTVIHANETSHTELWIALKGGSNNFGVVTHITLRTFPQGNIWGGYIYSSLSTAHLQLETFNQLIQPEHFDQHASSILSTAYDSRYGIRAIGHNIQYTKPQKSPVCFQPFLSLRRWWTTAKIKTLSASIKEITAHSPPGYR